jgi:hypothetical protein
LLIVLFGRFWHLHPLMHAKASLASPRTPRRFRTYLDLIKQTWTRPVSAATLSTWQGRSRSIMVDIDFVAAGAAETYSLMCVVTHGAAFVQQAMN